MQKIVINACHGGFGLSHEAIMRYAEKKGYKLIVKEQDNALCPVLYFIDKEGELGDENHLWAPDIQRDDPALVATVEELGAKANDRFSELKVVEIPDDVDWYIHDYDGLEWVAEHHRTWG
jgi:hypothetical protein